MRTRSSALGELTRQLRGCPPAGRWEGVAESFRPWAGQPGLREELRDHLRSLSGDLAAEVVARSRETTTHFAWCLLDEPGDPFSLWLHEYKPQCDWRPGYADSVHNHRYHFCTTILRGCYVHERFHADLDATGTVIRSATLLHSTVCPEGTTGTMLADEFHRIPQATDGTMTFLVKSRPVTTWSLSYDPRTRISRQHFPVEAKLGELANRL